MQEVDDTAIPPLTIACITGHTRIAKVLIEHGAIVNFIDKVFNVDVFRTCYSTSYCLCIYRWVILQFMMPVAMEEQRL